MLHGRVRLEKEGRPLNLRRKGLAVLAYLGVMGHGSRERLVRLLWENGSGRANLRVELHRLASATGRRVFAGGADPLRLPEWVSVERGGSVEDLLIGLEGLTPAFDQWIDTARMQLEDGPTRNRGVQAVAKRMARDLRAPFLVVVRARPGDDAREFTTTLASTLQLPPTRDLSATGPALRVLTPPYEGRAVQAVLSAREGGFVMEAPAYGEDPVELLELRNALDAARLGYVELPSLAWEDARAGVLHDLPFSRAARAYLLTGGSSGFLHELAQMAWPQLGPGEAPVIPQRIRAAYQLEVRYASMRARLALERLSAHPGAFSDGIVSSFDAGNVVDELERRGWLVYDGRWRFRGPEARNALYYSLQPGRRVGYHREAAMLMAVDGDWLGEAYHRLAAGDDVDWSASHAPQGIVADGVRAWRSGTVEGKAAAAVAATRGTDLAILEDRRHGPGIYGEGGRWRFVRWPGEVASTVWFELPERPSLLHLAGRAFAESPLGVGLDGASFPLELEVEGGGRAVFLQGLLQPTLSQGLLMLPLTSAIDEWFAVPSGAWLQLSSKAESAVMELQLEVHEHVGERAAAARESPWSVSAWDLEALGVPVAGSP